MQNKPRCEKKRIVLEGSMESPPYRRTACGKEQDAAGGGLCMTVLKKGKSKDGTRR